MYKYLALFGCGLLLACAPYVYEALIGRLRGSVEQSDAKTMAEQLFEDFWQWRLSDSPELATTVGVHKYDDILESYSLQSFQERKDKVGQFLKQAKELLKSIDDEWCSASLHIFIDGLEGFLRGIDTMGYLYPISFIEGIHVDLSQTIDYMVFKTADDYRKLISRYNKLPKQLEEVMELMREGVKQKRTLHAVSLKGVLERLAALQVPAKDSEFFERFKEFPESISESERKMLTQDAERAIERSVLPAFEKLRKFLKQEYWVHLRPEIAATSLPDGDAYYRECLRYHLELPLTAQEVHDMGLKEVERISTGMKEVIQALNLKMSPKEFSESLRSNASFRCKSSEEVVEGYNRILNQDIQPKLLEIFPTVPKSKLRVQLQPASKSSGPVAMYILGTPDGSRPGTFYVNANDLSRSPSFVMPALALHEGNPGHHLQGSYAMELPGMPTFRSQIEDRRYNDGPVHFPIHTAYVEGWGLYSEFLGYELGVYKTLYDRFGHLSQEMLRACRLVVDTGMHALGWSREKAINYLLEHTSSSQGEIESEIDRYITWPGQACAYKVGELKIKQLREKAKQDLGSKYDDRKFHKVVLDNPGPLTFLEKKVDEYIRETGKL
uniref:DUF885 domain-containing protein n=1 Tax=Ixodes ricinus TaxID=34613 RepID=A0A0K8R524_IXORI